MKAKMILWVMALGVLGLIMTQNWEFYMSRQALNLDLYYTQIHLPELPVAVLFLFVFIFGVLTSSLSFYIDRFVFRRQVKKLNSALESCSQKSAQLEAAMAGAERTEKPRSFFFWRRKSTELNRQPGEEGERGLVDPAPYQRAERLGS
ncbi:MAG: hypothetical protein ACM3KE_08165 [Hyphomicrobiales bacterium]